MSRGGGSSSNDKIVAAQKDEAQRARQDTADRNARMRWGMDTVRAAFNGGKVNPYYEFTETPVMGTRTQWRDNSTGELRDTRPTGTGGSTNPVGARVVMRSDFANGADPGNFSKVTSQYDTGKTRRERQKVGQAKTYSGIGDDFYDSYYNTVADHYTPQLEDQYAEAKSQNLFDLSRRGLLRSSHGADNTAEVEKEYALGKLDVANRAQQQRDNLVNDVNTAETNALNMVQGAEDPSAGIDAALREATAIQSRSPDLSGSLGNLFSAALNSYSNYQNVANARNYRDQAVAARSPTQSSGRNYA